MCSFRMSGFVCGIIFLLIVSRAEHSNQSVSSVIPGLALNIVLLFKETNVSFLPTHFFVPTN